MTTTRAGSLTVKVGADTKGFEDGIRRTAEKLNQLEGATDRAGRRITSFGRGMSRVGGNLSKYVSAPLAAAGGAAVAFATRFASAADQTAKAADKVGLATDTFQELRFAAERGGVESSAFEMAMMRLGKRTGEAATGTGRLAATLEDYGESAVDAAGNSRSTEDMLMTVADLVANAASETEALAITTAAFGNSGAGMVNVLRQGSAGLQAMAEEGRNLGAVLSEDTLRAGEQFQDQMTNLQTQMGAAANAIGVALLPAMNELIPVLTENVVPAVQAMAEGIASAIQWFVALPGPVQEAAGIVAAALGAGGPAVLAVGTFAKVLGGLVAAAGPVGLAIAAASALFAAWQIWGDDITELVETTIGYLGEKFTAFSDFAVETWTSMGEMILAAFRAPFDAIKGISDSVVGGMAEGWQWLSDTLVGNSVIPDMLDMMASQFQRLWGMADVNDQVARTFSRSWEKSADEQTKAIDGMASDALSTLGQLFEGSKVIAIAQAIVNTWKGVSQTLATYPWPLAGVLAGLHAAAGLANVASIRSTTKTGGGGSGSRSGAGGGSAATTQTAQPERQVVQTFRVEGLNRDSLVSGEQLISILDDAAKRGLTPEFVSG